MNIFISLKGSKLFFILIHNILELLECVVVWMTSILVRNASKPSVLFSPSVCLNEVQIGLGS